jgi:hypothetical protein
MCWAAFLAANLAISPVGADSLALPHGVAVPDIPKVFGWKPPEAHVDTPRRHLVCQTAVGSCDVPSEVIAASRSDCFCTNAVGESIAGKIQPGNWQ